MVGTINVYPLIRNKGSEEGQPCNNNSSNEHNNHNSHRYLQK